ncbi:hypothetical protein OG350_11750 [Streptomyces achromogenes]|uniref:Uncharacterized protein n=1 Tax=Streptomyces achromogenes TaxID=67255 RepID=A0ABZ1KK27_STRAH
MGGGERARGAGRRTCPKCGKPLPESPRRIPRVFCSRRHAGEAAFLTLLVVLGIVRALRWSGILG